MSGWQPTQFTRAQLEERRLAAVEWITRGTHKNQEIADHFGVSIHTVYSWKARLGRNGSLSATVACGPTARLTADQQEELRTLLQEGALDHGFPDDTWTTRRISELIGRTFDVWYHRDHVRKLLHRLNFTPQMPDGRAAERNELKIASWREQTAPELEKKSHGRGDADLPR